MLIQASWFRKKRFGYLLHVGVMMVTGNAVFLRCGAAQKVRMGRAWMVMSKFNG